MGDHNSSTNVSKSKFLFSLCGDKNKASSRVRGFWIAESLEEKGVHCTLRCRHNKLDLLRFAFTLLRNDVVVFQKVYSRWHCLLLRYAKLLKKKTVLDLDDAPSRTNNLATLRNVKFMMRNVSTVTVGSQMLFNYASKYSRNVHLIPSSIYLKYYQPPEKKLSKKPVCLGWIGNGKHYKLDLITILREPLIDLAKKHPIRFKIIGACGEQDLYDGFKDIQGLDIDFIDQIEWSNPNAVGKALLDIDIGLYPLLPEGSNQYKCGFKALEYMAMEIPVVSSNVAENREIIEHGVNGFLVESSSDWSSTLNRLISDNELRNRLGENGRRKVESQFSVSLAASQLLETIHLNEESTH